MSLFLDTSVLTSLYLGESRSRAVQEALAHEKDALVLSPLVELEFQCLMGRKVRASILDREACRRIAALFRRHVQESRYSVVAVQAAEYAVARQWLDDTEVSLRAVDALHLAAAATHELTLFTADALLARAAERFDVKFRLVA